MINAVPMIEYVTQHPWTVYDTAVDINVVLQQIKYSPSSTPCAHYKPRLGQVVVTGTKKFLNYGMRTATT